MTRFGLEGARPLGMGEDLQLRTFYHAEYSFPHALFFDPMSLAEHPQPYEALRGYVGMDNAEHGRTIRMNRAPVLTLWATVVAERLGFDHDAALTLGRAVAGSSAQIKGRALGIYEPSEEPPSKAAEERRDRLNPDEPFGVRLLGWTVPALGTPDGIRAMEKDFRAASAAGVERYLASKFGDHLEEVRAAMEQLAASLSPQEL